MHAILLNGDPLADNAVLADGRNIPSVLNAGVVVKEALQPATCARGATGAPPTTGARASWIQ